MDMNMSMKGRIHSIESMGLNDGPGIRTVVFFQGCRLRCIYCHNPDTLALNKGREITLEELMGKIIRYKPYFQTSKGGITCSGGEPLLQVDFLIEFLKSCRENNIHTTLDTTGFGRGRYDEVLKYTDLVLLDIKHMDAKGYKEICGGNIKELETFIEEVNKSSANVWVRHVVVPGYTDDEEDMVGLNKIINKINKVVKVELLPYHTLGVDKYKAMGREYKLFGVEDMDREEVKKLEEKIIIRNP